MERKMIKVDENAYNIIKSMRDALISTGQGASMSDAIRAFEEIAKTAGYKFNKKGELRP